MSCRRVRDIRAPDLLTQYPKSAVLNHVASLSTETRLIWEVLPPGTMPLAGATARPRAAAKLPFISRDGTLFRIVTAHLRARGETWKWLVLGAVCGALPLLLLALALPVVPAVGSRGLTLPLIGCTVPGAGANASTAVPLPLVTCMTCLQTTTLVVPLTSEAAAARHAAQWGMAGACIVAWGCLTWTASSVLLRGRRAIRMMAYNVGVRVDAASVVMGLLPWAVASLGSVIVALALAVRWRGVRLDELTIGTYGTASLPCVTLPASHQEELAPVSISAVSPVFALWQSLGEADPSSAPPSTIDPSAIVHVQFTVAHVLGVGCLAVLLYGVCWWLTLSRAQSPTAELPLGDWPQVNICARVSVCVSRRLRVRVRV